jgi:hypothetical protein
MGLPFLAKENPMKANPQSGLIKFWSNTSLDHFLECNYRSFLKSVKKLKVELSEEEEEQKNKAMERGSSLHAVIEDYIQDITTTLPKSIKHRREIIEEYRQKYLEIGSTVAIEEEWAFGPTWNPMDWKDWDTWVRIKIDAMMFESETSARIDDWKSGKKYGNEGKHMRQLQTYCCAAFLKYPKLQHIKASMQYIDLGTDNVLTRNVSREQSMAYLAKLENQALAMTTCVDFRPSPNLHNCKYCPFSARILGTTNERYCGFAIVEI